MKNTRRNFIKQSALMGAGFVIVPRRVLGGQGYIPPSDEITLGFIGLGKQGLGLGKRFQENDGNRIIGACDVDQSKLQRFRDKVEENYAQIYGSDYYEGCAVYSDWRELLDKDTIDAVVIATPDHWHGSIALAALKSGKDVYCEKPLSLTIHEGRQMVNATRKNERIFQTGSMQRSWKKFRHACELVRNGYIGEIQHVKVSVGPPPKPCNLPVEEILRKIDWNMWIGPAQYRGYNHLLAPPIPEKFWPKWRDYREFGGGKVTDWGAHMFDIAQWALGMDDTGPIEYFPPDGEREFLMLRYANGITMTHEDFGKGNAVRFIGSEGVLDVGRSFLDSNPASLANHVIKEEEIRLYESDNHYTDFLDAIRSRKNPICDVEIGHRTASICNIVNIAYELNRPLEWNPKKEKFIGDGEANLMRRREMREDWR
ncbi:MAG: Gfo/Idh/MocA family oxidoreductase [Bacteroidota bacterium]